MNRLSIILAFLATPHFAPQPEIGPRISAGAAADTQLVMLYQYFINQEQQAKGDAALFPDQPDTQLYCGALASAYNNAAAQVQIAELNVGILTFAPASQFVTRPISGIDR